MKIVLLNVEQAQSIYRSQMVRDFPESELKPFASVQGMMTRGLYEPLAFYDEAGALMAYAWQAVLPQCRNVLLDYFAVLPQYRGSGVGTAVLKELAAYYAPRKQSLIIECEHPCRSARTGSGKAAHWLLPAGWCPRRCYGKPPVWRAVPDLQPARGRACQR